MDRPIRVLFLTHNYPRHAADSSGVFLQVLARSLIRHGVAPIILAPHDAGLPQREDSGGVLVHRFRYDTDDRETLAYRGNMHQVALSSPAGMFRFRRFLKAFGEAADRLIDGERIDVVWGHWLVPAGVILKGVAVRRSIPLLLSSHGTDIRLLRKFGFLFRPYFRPLIGRLSTWTVVSHYLKDRIAEIDPNFASIIEVLPLPHDESIFRRDPAIQRDYNQIVAITRLTRQKRVSQLIEAMGMVRDSHPSARLDIWGAGPLQSQIEGQIRALGLSPHVAIHQPVSQRELADVYCSAGMVVLNSVDEGFGLALSEAMLCGSPTVGVRSGGITDIITDGRTGLIAQPDDPADLAAVILKMLRDAPLRDRLAETGHTTAISRYASGPLSAEYAQLIRNALPH
jgi:glycosyltransferase involved in cell wall biosynthesis